MSIHDTIYLFRLIHIDNLDYILTRGILTCPNHPLRDENYLNIGDQTLIKSRNKKQIPVEPGGYFHDYVAFYFGYRPPMLYEIQRGYNKVIKRHPSEIIYLVTTFDEVKNAGLSFVFTDGHAYHNFTQFFKHESELKHVDWSAVYLKKWNETEEDPDRKRRKQAELLIHKELPLELIKAFFTYDDAARQKILSIFGKHGFTCSVLVKPQWYY